MGAGRAISDERVDASERAVRSPTHRISYVGRLGAIAYAILPLSLSHFLSHSHAHTHTQLILSLSHIITLTHSHTHTLARGSRGRRLVVTSCLIVRERLNPLAQRSAVAGRRHRSRGAPDCASARGGR